MCATKGIGLGFVLSDSAFLFYQKPCLMDTNRPAWLGFDQLPQVASSIQHPLKVV